MYHTAAAEFVRPLHTAAGGADKNKVLVAWWLPPNKGSGMGQGGRWVGPAAGRGARLAENHGQQKEEQ